MWRFAIPGLGNLWMVLLKDTSLAAVIAVDDLLRQAKIGSETTRAPLTFYIAAGAIYLVLTGVSDLARERLERRARRGMAGVCHERHRHRLYRRQDLGLGPCLRCRRRR